MLSFISIFVDNSERHLLFLCVFVCMCICMCAYGCVWMYACEGLSWNWLLFTVLLETRSFIGPGAPLMAILAREWAPGVLLSLPSNHWTDKHILLHLAFTWVLVIQTRVLILVHLALTHGAISLHLLYL